jgi:hypothetical protein
MTRRHSHERDQDFSDVDRAALLAAGQTTRERTPPVDVDDPLVLDPDPWATPDDASGSGWRVDGSISTLVGVRLHARTGRRTCYLVVHPTLTPLSGDFTLELNGETPSTYTASSEASVSALMTEWAAFLTAEWVDGGIDQAVQSCTAVDYRGTGVLDAIEIVGKLDPADAADGLPSGHQYGIGFRLTTASAPQLAGLLWVREVDRASLRIHGRGSPTRRDAAVNEARQANLGLRAQADGWGLIGVVGPLEPYGYVERLNMAGLTAVWPHLYDPVTSDELTIVTSGAGLYGCVNVATVSVAAAVLP